MNLLDRLKISSEFEKADRYIILDAECNRKCTVLNHDLALDFYLKGYRVIPDRKHSTDEIKRLLNRGDGSYDFLNR